MYRQRIEGDFKLPFLSKELPSTKEPFFLWIHALPPHRPFNPPPPFFGRYLKSQETDKQIRRAAGLHTLKSNRGMKRRFPEASKKLRARYDENILYMDKGIARTLKIIRKTELHNPWVLLIFSDHGARRKDFFPDASDEEQLHIPLIICESGQFEGRRVQAPGEVLDFAPTILELIGVDPPKWMDGKSLVRIMESGR